MVNVSQQETGAELTREGRRHRTEAVILGAARELFAEVGFDKATIRAVASRAGVDPALVMQYYGNKDGLFAAAARWQVDCDHLTSAAPGELASSSLEQLLAKFRDPAHRDSAVALLRNCLTHDAASAAMRGEVMAGPAQVVAERVGGPDADLRAGLLGATMIGVMIGRWVLGLPSLVAAEDEDLRRVLLPVLRGLLLEDPAEPAGPGAPCDPARQDSGSRA